MRREFLLAGLVSFVMAVQAQPARTYTIAAGNVSTLPASNSVNDLVVRQDTVWFGTGKGLSTTTNDGASFTNFAGTATFDTKGISGLAVNDRFVWAATAFTHRDKDQTLPAGGGLHYSADWGATWTFVPQPVDEGLVDSVIYGVNTIRALAITTVVNNISYDVALTSNAVWTANFAGMLRKSLDSGRTWQRVVLPPDNRDQIRPTDTLDFDLAPTGGASGLRGNLNHRVFSVFAADDQTIWVGTAGGINRSTDGGQSWQKYSRQNQAQPISGNFVVAIREQRWGTRRIVWAATVNAEASEEQRGVSYSEDGGTTWRTALLGEFAHNIAFRDSVVYIATDNGLFRSSDVGVTWARSGSVVDAENKQRFASREVFGVATKGDTVWMGGPEGTAYTLDHPSSPFGSKWRVMRTYVPASAGASTYSYPSPFSPDDEVVRIHYAVTSQAPARITIRVFDFAMHPVITLARDAVRQPGEWDELWDGRDEQKRRVANGVYFYRLDIEGSESQWGKIFAIQ